MWSDRQISGHFNQHASLTWPVERVARPIVVVSLIKGQPDVCGTFRGLLEHQARHVAPQLEGSAHRQPHRAQRQVARPVHYLVGQVTFVPLLDWRTHTHTQRQREEQRFETCRSEAHNLIHHKLRTSADADKLRSLQKPRQWSCK